MARAEFGKPVVPCDLPFAGARRFAICPLRFAIRPAVAASLRGWKFDADLILASGGRRNAHQPARTRGVARGHAGSFATKSGRKAAR